MLKNYSCKPLSIGKLFSTYRTTTQKQKMNNSMVSNEEDGRFEVERGKRIQKIDHSATSCGGGKK